MQRLRSFVYSHKTLFLSLGFLFLFSWTVAKATPPGSAYTAGATLDPQCIPGSTNCTVTITSGGGTIYTFGTGLTNTSGTVTNNLLTGLSGGQTIFGDTASGGNLTLSSTSNATKGKILFGNSTYDEANNRLGIGTATPSDPLEVNGEIKAGNLNVTGTTVTVSAPTNFQAIVNYSETSSSYIANGAGLYGPSLYYVVYAYVNLGNGQRAYSIGNSQTVSDDGSGNPFSVDLSWNAVPGADGYLISFSDPSGNDSGGDIHNGGTNGNYDTLDPSVTHITDDGCTSVCFNAATKGASSDPYSNINTLNGTLKVNGALVTNANIISGDPFSVPGLSWSSSFGAFRAGITYGGSVGYDSFTPTSGYGSAAFGYDTQAGALDSAAFGAGNIGGGDPVNWVGTDPLFEVGNSSSSNKTGERPFSNSDALMIYKNGNFGIGKAMQGDFTGALLTGVGNNVGINTITPQATLEIVGTGEQLRLSYDASNHASFTTGSGGQLTIAAGGTNQDIILTPSGSGKTAISSDETTGFYGRSGNSFDIVNGSNAFITVSPGSWNMKGSLIFGWDSNATNTQASAIDTAFTRLSAGKLALGNGSASDFTGTFIAGKIGIANSSPGHLLDVGSSSTLTGTAVAQFINAGGTCTVTPSTTGGITCTSDMTLKKNITNLSDNSTWSFNSNITIANQSVLDKVLALNPVNYNWNVEANTDPTHTGFIAQEVQQVFPDLVSVDPITNILSLNYTGLIPYTIEAIKEMNVRITSIDDLTKVNNWRDALNNWFADTSNGIKSFFSDTVHTNNLCVGTVCVTQQQFLQMVSSSAGSSGGTQQNSGPTTSNIPPTPDTQGGDQGQTQSPDTVPQNVTTPPDNTQSPAN
jgi:hypothetical protein